MVQRSNGSDLCQQRQHVRIKELSLIIGKNCQEHNQHKDGLTSFRIYEVRKDQKNLFIEDVQRL